MTTSKFNEIIKNPSNGMKISYNLRVAECVDDSSVSETVVESISSVWSILFTVCSFYTNLKLPHLVNDENLCVYLFKYVTLEIKHVLTL